MNVKTLQCLGKKLTKECRSNSLIWQPLPYIFIIDTKNKKQARTTLGLAGEISTHCFF